MGVTLADASTSFQLSAFSSQLQVPNLESCELIAEAKLTAEATIDTMRWVSSAIVIVLGTLVPSAHALFERVAGARGAYPLGTLMLVGLGLAGYCWRAGRRGSDLRYDFNVLELQFSYAVPFDATSAAVRGDRLAVNRIGVSAPEPRTVRSSPWRSATSWRLIPGCLWLEARTLVTEKRQAENNSA